MDNFNDKLRRGAMIVFGGVPDSWNINTVQKMGEQYVQLPLLDGVLHMPVVTFLYYCKERMGGVSGINSIGYINPLLDRMKTFAGTYGDMKEEAALVSSLDIHNSTVELNTFKSITDCITCPHMSISPVYRYLMAQLYSVETAVTDGLERDAVTQLRQNPFFFMSYGPDCTRLMPVTWEGL